MANVWFISNGNMSNAAIYNTGALPTANDDLYCNNFAGVLDINLTVLSVSNKASVGITQGGTITISGTYSLTCTGTGLSVLNGSGGLILVTANSPNIVDITATAVATNNRCVIISGTATVNYNGNTTGGSDANSQCIRITAACIFNYTGTYTGGGGANGNAIHNTSNAATVNITGIGIGNSAPGFFSDVATPVVVNGNVSVANGGTSAAIVLTSATSLLTYGGTITNYLDVMAIRVINMRMISGSFTNWNISDSSGSVINLAQQIGYPATGDVRNLTVYGSTNNLTGTLIVAPPASVALNVPTDHTVGTMVASGATAAEVWDYLINSPIVPNSILELILTNLDAKVSDIPADTITELDGSTEDVAVRLQNCATVETTGDQLAALP